MEHVATDAKHWDWLKWPENQWILEEFPLAKTTMSLVFTLPFRNATQPPKNWSHTHFTTFQGFVFSPKNTSVEWTIPNSPLLITCSFTLLTCSHAPTAGHGTLGPFLREACSTDGGRSKSRGKWMIKCFMLLKKCQQNARKSAIITGMHLFNKWCKKLVSTKC